MPDGAMSAVIRLDGLPDTDAEELDDLTTGLRRDPLEIDVQPVIPDEGSDPPLEAKAAEVLTIGAVAISVSPVLIASVVRLMESWIKNRPVRKLTLLIDNDRLEISHPSRSEQQLLVEAFIAKHAGQ